MKKREKSEYFWWKVILFILITTFLTVNFGNLNFEFRKEKEEIKIGIIKKYDLSKIREYSKIRIKNINVTYYTNIEEETDEEPDVMASGRIVYEGAIAISRDLKKKYNLKFGDIIYLESINRYFILEDVMNERHKYRVDIFTFDNTKLKKSFKSDITIYKIN